MIHKKVRKAAGVVDYEIWENDMDKYAIITDSGLKITYNELNILEDTFAKKIEKNSLILIVCNNNIETLIAYIGCLKNSIVPIMVGSDIKIEKLCEVIYKYKPMYIWISKDSVYKIMESFRTDELKYEYKYGSYNLIRFDTQQKFQNSETCMYKDLALLLSTSGSIGSTKFVRISKKNIITNTLDIIQSLHIKDTDRAITTLPVNYTYGLSVVNTHLYVGATLLLTDKKIFSNDFWHFFKINKGTSFAGVPYTFEMVEKLKLYKKFPDTLKTITQAGGRLSIDLQRKICEYIEKKNIDFYVMYGQTEATARITCMKSTLGKPFGSVGKPIGKEKVLFSESGEVIVQGNNVSLGYAMDYIDLTKGDENKGVLYTGDIGYRDDEGYIYICGRLDRMVKIYGNRINLDELDDMLKRGFTGYSFISCAKDNRVYVFSDYSEKEKIIQYINDKTQLNKIIFHIFFTSEIVRKENGKIDYQYYNRYLT